MVKTKGHVCRRCKEDEFRVTPNAKLECSNCGTVVGKAVFNAAVMPRSEVME